MNLSSIQRYQDRFPPSPPDLKGGSGDGTSEGMPDTPTREEIAARLEAAEARTGMRFAELSATLEGRFGQMEARSARLEGKLDTLAASMAASVSALAESVKDGRAEARSSRLTLLLATLGTGLTVLGVVLATMIGLKQVWVGGVQVGQVAQEAAHSSATPPQLPAPTKAVP